MIIVISQAIFALILSWVTFVLNSTSPLEIYSLLHVTNLVIHGAGHAVFGPLGTFLGILGGPLIQILLPLSLIGYFSRRGAPYASAVMIWWLGESFVDLVPYIADANKETFSSIGGQHDFSYLLNTLGISEHNTLIAQIAFVVGMFLMIISIAIMFRNVYYRLRSFRKKETKNNEQQPPKQPQYRRF